MDSPAGAVIRRRGGGFAGGGPPPVLAGGAGGPGGGSSTSAITSWVKAHYRAETIGGQTVYDLTQPLQSIASLPVVGRSSR